MTRLDYLFDRRCATCRCLVAASGGGGESGGNGSTSYQLDASRGRSASGFTKTRVTWSDVEIT